MAYNAEDVSMTMRDVKDFAESFKDVFHEFYEVVRTVEVHMEENTYRVEVLKGSDGIYTARYWIERQVILQPEERNEQGNLVKPASMRAFVKDIWVAVNMHDPDAALAQALGFLRDSRPRAA